MSPRPAAAAVAAAVAAAILTAAVASTAVDAAVSAATLAAAVATASIAASRAATIATTAIAAGIATPTLIATQPADETPVIPSTTTPTVDTARFTDTYRKGMPRVPGQRQGLLYGDEVLPLYVALQLPRVWWRRHVRGSFELHGRRTRGERCPFLRIELLRERRAARAAAVAAVADAAAVAAEPPATAAAAITTTTIAAAAAADLQQRVPRARVGQRRSVR